MEKRTPEFYKEQKKKILVIGDNQDILNAIARLASEYNSEDIDIEYACSPSESGQQLSIENQPVAELDIKQNVNNIIEQEYSVILSAHCKQIFPQELVDRVRCVNIHPGYNPYNRGMFPHVFSIINGLPAGATLHEMNSEIDSGDIIDQVQVRVEPTDTSESLYNRVLDEEKRLLGQYLARIITGEYRPVPTNAEGNLNRKKDYEALKKIDTESTGTFMEHINQLRALSHGGYKNAYYIDRDTGKKIWIRVVLEEEA